MNRFIMVIAMTTLLACTHINPITALRLSRLNIMTLNPSETQLRAEYPENWEVVPDSFVFKVTATNEDTGESLERGYVLSETQSTEGPFWGFDNAAQQDIAKLKAEISKWKDLGQTGRGSVGFTLDLC